MFHHQFHFLVRLWRHAVDFPQYVKAAFDVGLMRAQAVSRRLLGKKAAPRRGVPLLLHYHIFKNAGSSFEWTLQQAFGKAFHKYDGTAAGGVLSADDVANYVKHARNARVICSHQATLPPPKIRGREVITSILIRDPIARIRSIYAFEQRQEARSPGAMKAKELDFKGYVEWRLENSPSMLCNSQVHFCARGKQSSPKGDAKALLRKAIANLDQVDLVGTVARYNEWLALVQVVLSQRFPDILLVVTRQNVTDIAGETQTEKTILERLVRDLGPALADHLVRANELDMSLHQIADALLTRQLAEHGVDVTLRNAYADARKEISGDLPDRFSETA